jgi:2-aminomuconate deaminase
LLFLSGIGPRTRGTSQIPSGIEAQCRAVFENVRTVLEDAGSSWEKIVDVTVFLTDMTGDFAAYNKLYAEYFAGEGKPNPTRTTVEVTRLPTPIAIELKVIATA